ncbi:MAG: aspartate carbamoyltransferase [Gammaproteobacteria bacterium RIFCSPHIGHO2_12_FULL_40_19]|nr:MAG: aspartate carbamoyltransferase [Gammaproteobacteria bacterium RIFCSPHIGHO2_12_FULL_40_19]
MLKMKTTTPPPVLHNLLSMQALDAKKITYLLDRADYFLKTAVAKQEVLTTLRGKVIVNLFFEPSTRTRNSFEIAEHRLGAIVLSPDMKQSSTTKGEILIDTICNLEAMGASLLVIRHPDNNLTHFLASELKTKIAVVNAGDGSNEHPTQTLLDLMTIRQHYPDFSRLTVAILGDVSHSRVAHSLIIGLRLMGVERIRIIAPDYFTPEDADLAHLDVFHSMDDGLNNVDIVYALRIQKERMQPEQRPKDDQFFKNFGLTEARLALAKQNAIVMHPGPMNRGVEIESSVADGSQSVILQQTQNSVAVRMAVLETLLNKP